MLRSIRSRLSLISAIMVVGFISIAAPNGITTQQTKTAPPTGVANGQSTDVEGTSLAHARADHLHSTTGFPLPGACPPGQYETQDSAGGAPSCAQVQFSQLGEEQISDSEGTLRLKWDTDNNVHNTSGCHYFRWHNSTNDELVACNGQLTPDSLFNLGTASAPFNGLWVGQSGVQVGTSIVGNPDLGSSSRSFDQLYLTGGVYGTGNTERLDTGNGAATKLLSGTSAGSGDGVIQLTCQGSACGADKTIISFMATGDGTPPWKVDNEGDQFMEGSLTANGVITGGSLVGDLSCTACVSDSEITGAISAQKGGTGNIDVVAANSILVGHNLLTDTRVQTPLYECAADEKLQYTAATQIFSCVPDLDTTPDSFFARDSTRCAPSYVGATTLSCDGSFTPTVTGAAGVTPSTGFRMTRMIKAVTGTGLGDSAGIIVTALQGWTDRQFDPVFEAGISTLFLDSGDRIWVGMASGDMSAVPVRTEAAGLGSSSVHFVAVGYDQNVDASWMICQGNGSSYLCKDTGVTPLASGNYEITLEWDDTTNDLDWRIVEISGGSPASGTVFDGYGPESELDPTIMITGVDAAGASTSTLYIHKFRVTQN